jgi:hypothetical protein
MIQSNVTEQPATASPGLIESTRTLIALLFTVLFLLFAAYLGVLSIGKLTELFTTDRDSVETLIKAINLAIVGVAIFELATSIHKEYVGDHAHIDPLLLLRRGIARFVGVVCTALALEGLIMAIKYSQLDLAGNLYYAVGVVTSAALLLAALGVFLKLSEPRHAALST